MTERHLQERARNSFAVSLVVLTFARLVLNMGRRFGYPFLPAISRGLGVPLESVQNLFAVNGGIGIFSPLFGPLSDRYGRKPVMLTTLLLMSAAGFSAALAPRFTIFAIAVLAFGVAKMVYDPAMQAAVGERIPYARRALAMGATELSWAGALIVVAPLAGFLIAGYGVGALMGALGALALAAAALVWLLLPGGRPRDTISGTQVSAGIARLLRENGAARGVVAYTLCLTMANEIFFINYGAWMEQSFDLVLATLGIASTIIAAAEVLGEIVVMAVADRLGKRRLALFGAAGSALVYPMLPFLSSSLALTLTGVFCLFFFFEIAIVASLPLFTEVAPTSRGALMSGNFAAGAVGRLSGAIFGGALFRWTGSLYATGAVALLLGLCAAYCLLRFVHEHVTPVGDG